MSRKDKKKLIKIRNYHRSLYRRLVMAILYVPALSK